MQLYIRLLFLSSISLFSTSVDAQRLNDCSNVNQVFDFLETYHYSPKELEPKLRDTIINGLFNQVNDQGALFTYEDALKMQVYDDAFLVNADSTCEALNLMTELYIQRLTKLEALVNQISQEEILFREAEYFCSNPDTLLTEEEWVDYWTKYFKFNILSTVVANLDSADATSYPSEVEIDIWKARVCERTACRMQHRLKSRDLCENMIMSTLMNSITMSFDPHTNFFSSFQMNMFERGVSSNQNSFGIEYMRNGDGEIEVAYLTPGGPAWEDDQLEEGDILISGLSGQIGGMNFNCSSDYEVHNFLHNEGNTSSEFTFRKPNGQEVTIRLSKAEIPEEENTIRTFILDGDRKLGYIYLPTFYASEQYWNENLGCAADLGRELIRLKRAGVEGLILDIRNNGGGYMMEAVRMAGLFINYGTVAISTDNYEGTVPLNDPQRGLAYDGPLVVMVNNHSASASELLAAAIQDYNRGVIVGDTTFGKATMQNVIPFSWSDNSKEIPENQDYIKTTTGCFYRPTGTSHQGVGVIPDVSFPNPEYHDPVREGDITFHLEVDSIEPVGHFNPLDELPIDTLVALSSRRNIRDSSRFETYYYDEGLDSIPLQFAEYVTTLNEMNESNSASERFKSDFKIEPLRYVMGIDGELNRIIMRQVQTDYRIYETTRILNDLIELSKPIK